MIKLFTKRHDHDYKVDKNISVNHHESKSLRQVPSSFSF